MYSAHNISTIFRVPRLGCVHGCCASSAFAPAGCWVSYPPGGLRLVSQFLPALLIMERSTMVCCAWQTLSCCARSALLLRTPGLKSDGPALSPSTSAWQKSRTSGPPIHRSLASRQAKLGEPRAPQRTGPAAPPPDGSCSGAPKKTGPQPTRPAPRPAAPLRVSGPLRPGGLGRAVMTATGPAARRARAGGLIGGRVGMRAALARVAGVGVSTCVV